MELTREYLEEKRAELSAQYDRSLADANAASGGIQVIDVLLARLEEPEEE
jgi:hypothetical protein